MNSLSVIGNYIKWIKQRIKERKIIIKLFTKEIKNAKNLYNKNPTDNNLNEILKYQSRLRERTEELIKYQKDYAHLVNLLI